MFTLLPLVILTACGPPAADTKTFTPGVFERVDLRNEAGNITLSTSEEQSVEAAMTWRGDGVPNVTTRLAGDTLLVDANCAGVQSCAVDISLSVRPGVDVDIYSRYGNVHVNDLEGLLDVQAESGNVTLTGTSGPARILADLGDVTLFEVMSSLDVVAPRGRVEGTALSSPTADIRGDHQGLQLIFETQPDILELSTGRGDIEVALPRGDYDIDSTSARGDVRVSDVTNTPGAGSVLIVRSVRGDIVVRGN